MYVKFKRPVGNDFSIGLKRCLEGSDGSVGSVRHLEYPHNWSDWIRLVMETTSLDSFTLLHHVGRRKPTSRLLWRSLWSLVCYGLLWLLPSPGTLGHTWLRVKWLPASMMMIFTHRPQHRASVQQWVNTQWVASEFKFGCRMFLMFLCLYLKVAQLQWSCLGAVLVQFHLPDSKIRTLRGSLNFALVTALVGTLIQSFTPIEGKLKTWC